MLSKKRRKVPIKEGLFVIPDSDAEKPYLLGSKCNACGGVVFPKEEGKAMCPRCSSEDMEVISLSRRGKVVNSSVVAYPPDLYKGPVPYTAAHVLLPEGVLIPTQLTNCPKDNPMPMNVEAEMYLEKFKEDDEGNEVLMYKFKV